MAIKTYSTRHEYMTENTVDWLKSFADSEGEKLAKQNNIDPGELKNAGYMDNILSIVERKKKQSVADKVQHYRELIGLDLLDNLEKEGGKEIIASRMSLSIRDKVAQDQKQIFDTIRQYVDEVMKNRNGVVATPALLEQFENYMKLDKEWLRQNYKAIEDIISSSRNKFQPKDYKTLNINELARTDDPSKGETKEPTPFTNPAGD